jgi:hypothetical protein
MTKTSEDKWRGLIAGGEFGGVLMIRSPFVGDSVGC